MFSLVPDVLNFIPFETHYVYTQCNTWRYLQSNASSFALQPTWYERAIDGTLRGVGPVP